MHAEHQQIWNVSLVTRINWKPRELFLLRPRNIRDDQFS